MVLEKGGKSPIERIRLSRNASLRTEKRLSVLLFHKWTGVPQKTVRYSNYLPPFLHPRTTATYWLFGTLDLLIFRDLPQPDLIISRKCPESCSKSALGGLKVSPRNPGSSISKVELLVDPEA